MASGERHNGLPWAVRVAPSLLGVKNLIARVVRFVQMWALPDTRPSHIAILLHAQRDVLVVERCVGLSPQLLATIGELSNMTTTGPMGVDKGSRAAEVARLSWYPAVALCRLTLASRFRLIWWVRRVRWDRLVA